MECSVYATVQRTHISEKRIKDIVFFVLKRLRKGNVAVSVHLIGDKKMRHLNHEYRGIDKVTDVLSFALHSPNSSVLKSKGGEAVDWGDMFICVPQIVRQAKYNEVSKSEEMSRMLIHGVLHLFGFDHVKKRDADKMFKLQESIVRAVNK